MIQDISHSYESYKVTEYSENQTNNDINKLDVSANHSCPYQNGSSKNIIQQQETERSFFQYRYLVAFLEFLGFFEINLFRLVTSVSVVNMVNNTAVDSHKISNVVVASCPFNVSNLEENDLPENTGEFDWSPAMQGYVLGAGFLGYVVTQMPGGILAESYGAKFTVGLIAPAQCVLAANWFPSNERSLLNPLIMSGYAFGCIIGGFSSGAMCSSHLFGGWPSVYYIYGALGLLLSVCVQLFMYESPKCHPKIKDSELNYILQNQETDLSQKSYVCECIKMTHCINLSHAGIAKVIEASDSKEVSEYESQISNEIESESSDIDLDTNNP
ncbi:putative inorganic phosphate cotransporter [Trichonephila clavata]|uniref:Putative inorganic phosphate cotransporter n=1 Tax=Trichonephila clavata TaxID=2740835 RepID=A0A8X6H871_TRICU|nr:putative inorganic phosphate cotransporter [Trichonephila clavata]